MDGDSGFWELSSARACWGSREVPYLCRVITTKAEEAVDHLFVQSVAVVLADSPTCQPQLFSLQVPAQVFLGSPDFA